MSFQDNSSKFYEALQLNKQLSYRGFRDKAWQEFCKTGLPIKTEDWKYTNLSALHNLNFHGSSELAKKISELVKEQALLEHFLVLVDGKVSLESSNLPKESLLEFKILSQDAEQDSVNANTLGSIQKFAPADFQSLNSALFEDAVILNFPKGFSLPSGLQIIHLSSANFSAPRIFYKIASGVSLEIVESYFSLETDLRLVAPVNEYYVAENADLKVYKLVDENVNTYHIANQVSQVAESASFHCFTFNLQNGVTRNNLFCRLVGKGAFASLIGLNVVGNQEHVDNFTVLDHVSPNCESFELYKSVLGQEAQTVFNGTIIVEPDAQKTNAIQSNQSLLLSETAKSFAKPQLKIWADDVKCTHGATAGNLDPEALFYLRARGISEAQARRLLVEAFASEVVDKLKNERVANFIKHRIGQKLENLF